MVNFYEKDNIETHGVTHGENGYFSIRTVKNLEFPLLQEGEFKLIYIISGILQLTLLDESYEMFDGDCVLIFPGQIHSALTYTASECKIFTFLPIACDDFYRHTLGKASKDCIYKLDTDLDYLESIEEDGDHFMNKSHLYAILSGYLQKANLQAANTKNTDFTIAATAYVQEYCTEEITLAGLSEHLGYGYNYTSALFKQNFKCNFLFFVNQHRINLAEKILLSRADLSITDIAFECGFNSLRSFGRNFSAQKGISPKEFRNKNGIE